MLTILPPPCAVAMKSGNLKFLEPSGHSRPVTGLLYLFTLALGYLSLIMVYIFVSLPYSVYATISYTFTVSRLVMRILLLERHKV